MNQCVFKLKCMWQRPHHNTKRWSWPLSHSCSQKRKIHSSAESDNESLMSGSMFLRHKHRPTSLYNSDLLEFPVISMEVAWLVLDMLEGLTLLAAICANRYLYLVYKKSNLIYFINPTFPCSNHIFTKRILVISASEHLMILQRQYPFLFPFWHVLVLNLKMYKMP